MKSKFTQDYTERVEKKKEREQDKDSNCLLKSEESGGTRTRVTPRSIHSRRILWWVVCCCRGHPLGPVGRGWQLLSVSNRVIFFVSVISSS